MGFSRQDYWSRFPCSSPGDPPDPGIVLKPLSNSEGWQITWYKEMSMCRKVPRTKLIQSRVRVLDWSSGLSQAIDGSISVLLGFPWHWCSDLPLPWSISSNIGKYLEFHFALGVNFGVCKLLGRSFSLMMLWPWSLIYICISFIF